MEALPCHEWPLQGGNIGGSVGHELCTGTGKVEGWIDGCKCLMKRVNTALTPSSATLEADPTAGELHNSNEKIHVTGGGGITDTSI